MNIDDLIRDYRKKLLKDIFKLKLKLYALMISGMIFILALAVQMNAVHRYQLLVLTVVHGIFVSFFYYLPNFRKITEKRRNEFMSAVGERITKNLNEEK